MRGSEGKYSYCVERREITAGAKPVGRTARTSCFRQLRTLLRMRKGGMWSVFAERVWPE